eukprot:scaffold6815_cov30-Cyclotella_meneghiniana.AAC.1
MAIILIISSCRGKSQPATKRHQKESLGASGLRVGASGCEWVRVSASRCESVRVRVVRVKREQNASDSIFSRQ